jgi:hypothetical protein
LLTWRVLTTRSRRRLSFQLAPSIPRNSGTGIGLWQTPSVVDQTGRQYQYVGKNRDKFLCLPGQVKATWPTPKQPQGSACRTDKNLNHLHRMDDVTPISGEIVSGSLALTEKFVERLTTLSAWLMGYTGAYLARWETASSRRSRMKSSGQ